MLYKSSETTPAVVAAVAAVLTYGSSEITQAVNPDSETAPITVAVMNFFTDEIIVVPLKVALSNLWLLCG